MNNKTYESKIPIYLKKMVDVQITKAKEFQDKETMSFSFFTDPHITETSTFADIETLNYIKNNMDIKFTACCGDNLDNGITKQIHLATAAELIDKLMLIHFQKK